IIANKEDIFFQQFQAILQAEMLQPFYQPKKTLQKVIKHHKDKQTLLPIASNKRSNKEQKPLQEITNNIIIQIPATEKPLDIKLKISFNK
ncbi:9695_t:CDS:1, partial [Dentiscutata erythropus]